MVYFNWLWAGLMVPLLCVCLTGGSLVYAFLFGFWSCFARFEGALPRRWAVALVVSSLLQLAAVVAVNIAATWSAEVRTWAFGAPNASSRLAVGPLLVKGVLGVRDWGEQSSVAHAQDSALLANTTIDMVKSEPREDSAWRLSVVVNTLIPSVALLVYVLACSRWLCRRTRTTGAPPIWHASSGSGTQTPSLGDSLSAQMAAGPHREDAEEPEDAPLLGTRTATTLSTTTSNSVLRVPMPSSLPWSSAAHRVSAAQGRWRRVHRLWSITLIVLCACQSWAWSPVACATSSSPASSAHVLLFDLPLEVVAMMSWWCLRRVVPRARPQRRSGSAILAHISPEHTRAQRRVERVLSVSTIVLALPAMTLAVARNAYVRHVLTEVCPSTRVLEATIGVSTSLSGSALWRVIGLLCLALVAAALCTRWRHDASTPVTATAGAASLTRSPRGSTVATRSSRRSSLALSAAPRRAADSTATTTGTNTADVTTPEGNRATARLRREDGTSLSPSTSVEGALSTLPQRAPAAREADSSPTVATRRAHSRAIAASTALTAPGISCSRSPRALSDTPTLSRHGGGPSPSRAAVFSWRWLAFIGLPLHAALLPSIGTAVGAVAYLQNLCSGRRDWTSHAVGTVAPTPHRSSWCGAWRRAEYTSWCATRLLLAVALLAQLAAMSLAPWLPCAALEVLWTAAWWAPTQGSFCQCAQHGLLLLAFCTLVDTSPEDERDATVPSRESEGRGAARESEATADDAPSSAPFQYTEATQGDDNNNNNTEMHASMRTPRTSPVSTSATPVSPAVAEEAIRTLGAGRYRQVLAFARRASALMGDDAENIEGTASSEAAARLDLAFFAWLGRPATALERACLLRAPLLTSPVSSLSASTAPAAAPLSLFTLDEFVRARVAAAASIQGSWWRLLTAVPHALRELLWRTAPTGLTVVVLTLAASLCVSHTHIMSLCLAAVALVLHARGAMDYGTATTHGAGRLLIGMCALSFYACLGFSYVVRVQQRAADEEDVPLAACEWLELVGLWPRRAAWSAWLPFVLALVALDIVHHASLRAGALTDWHRVLDRVECQRAMAYPGACVGATVGAHKLCLRVLQWALGLALTVWLSAHQTFHDSTSSTLLWCLWAAAAITVAAQTSRRTRACVRTVVVLCMRAGMVAVAITQLPLVQERCVTWLSRSTTHCAAPTLHAGAAAEELRPPWTCMRTLGLYFFPAAPPPSVCDPVPEPGAASFDAAWRLLPYLLPWALLSMTTRWLHVSTRGAAAAYEANSEASSTTHPTETSAEDDVDVPPRDVPVLYVALHVTARLVDVGRAWCWTAIRHARLPIVWTSLSAASASMRSGGALRLPYMVLLLFDAPPLVSAVYSVVYMVVLCAYQLPWVPPITATLTLSNASWWWLSWLCGSRNGAADAPTMDVARFLGLRRTPVPTSSLSLVGCPLLVLLATLPALSVASNAPRAGAENTTGAQSAARDDDENTQDHRDGAKGWLHFFFSPAFFAMVVYELVVFSLLMLLITLQSHALGVLVLLCLVVVWYTRRDVCGMSSRRLPRCVLWVTMGLCISAAAAKLLFDAATVVVTPTDATHAPIPVQGGVEEPSAVETAVVPGSEPQPWRDWWSLTSLTAPQTLMGATALLVISTHLTARVLPYLEENRRVRLTVLDGSTDLLSHIRRALPGALAAAATVSQPTAGADGGTGACVPDPRLCDEDVDHVYLPALPPAVFESVVPSVAVTHRVAQTYTARLSRLLVYAMGYTSPFALLTFVTGAMGHPSLLHVVLMVTALLEVTYMEAIQWRAFRWWRALSNTYVMTLAVLPVVVHVPAVCELLRAHEGFFTVLGLLVPVSSTCSAPIDISAWSAAALFAVCLQSRALEDVWSTAYLHRLYRSYGKRRARYEELQSRIARENEAEVAAVLAYDAALRQRLTVMREYDHRHEPLVSAPLLGRDRHDLASPLWLSTLSASPHVLNTDRAAPPHADAAHTPLLIRWALRIIHFLAPHTYRPEKVRVDPAVLASPGRHTQYVLWRLFIAFRGVAESHTVVLVVVSALANCLFTGAVFELAGLAYLLLVVLPWYPYPPQVAYQRYFLYVTAGIVLKAAVSLLAARVRLPEGLLNCLAWTLVQVSHAPSPLTSSSSPAGSTPSVAAMNAVPYTSTIKYAYVVVDFVVFSALTVHHYASVWNGVYRAERGDDADHHSEIALSPDATDAHLAEAAADVETPDTHTLADDVMEEDHPDDEEAWSSVQALHASVGEWTHVRLIRLRGYWLRMTTTIAMGTDTYTVYTTLDALAMILVTFAYTSMSSSAHTTLQDNVRDNMVPGTLALIIAASAIHLVVERMLYVRRAMGAKVVLTMGSTLVYCGVYCWWRHTTVGQVSSGSAPDLTAVQVRTRLAQTLTGLYFVLKIGAATASVIQVRKGFPRRRPHDCFTGHPESLTLYTLHTCFRSVPFLWECRALIDWTMMYTSLSLDSFLKVEDVYDTVYLRRVRIAGLMNQPKLIGTPVSRRSKALTGMTRLVLLLAALLAPLLYYSTLNPAVQSNPVTQLDVSFSFNGARPFYAALIQSPDNSTSMPSLWRQYLALTRPSLTYYGAFLSAATDVQRLELAACSEELWLISPTAQQRFEEALEEVANQSETRRTASPSSQLASSTASHGKSGLHAKPPSEARLSSSSPGVSIVQTLQVSRASRDASGSSSSALSWSTRWELPRQTARELIDAIRHKPDASAARGAGVPSVHLPFFYTPFTFNHDASVSTYQPDEPTRSYRNRLNCSLQLRVEHEGAESAAVPNTVRYWCVACEPLFTSGDVPTDDPVAYPERACLNGSLSAQQCATRFNFEDAARGSLEDDGWRRHQDPALWLPLRYVTLSPSVVVKLPFLNGLGIVALYTTFVLALGRLMRSLFSAKAKAVIQTDMANPAPVSQLLACIYTARECAELELEETAYLELIDLLRSPERLLAVTGHVQQLHQQLADMNRHAAPSAPTAVPEEEPKGATDTTKIST